MRREILMISRLIVFCARAWSTLARPFTPRPDPLRSPADFSIEFLRRWAHPPACLWQARPACIPEYIGLCCFRFPLSGMRRLTVSRREHRGVHPGFLVSVDPWTGAKRTGHTSEGPSECFQGTSVARNKRKNIRFLRALSVALREGIANPRTGRPLRCAPEGNL